QKLRSNAAPTPDIQPEGSKTGSEQGTAATGAEGDPCATAIFNAVQPGFKTPETISERQLDKLVTRVRIRVGKDGSLTDPKIIKESGNGLFDNAVLEAIEKVGR